MGFVGDFLRSNIRREMKERTQEILRSVESVKDSLDKHTAAIERLLAYLEGSEATPSPGKIAREFSHSAQKVANSEAKLGKAIVAWKEFMEKAVRELQ